MCYSFSRDLKEQPSGALEASPTKSSKMLEAIRRSHVGQFSGAQSLMALFRRKAFTVSPKHRFQISTLNIVTHTSFNLGFLS